MKHKMAARDRHVHHLTINNDVWDALIEHCMRHNQNPGEVVEAALRKHVDADLQESFG